METVGQNGEDLSGRAAGVQPYHPAGVGPRSARRSVGDRAREGRTGAVFGDGRLPDVPRDSRAGNPSPSVGEGPVPETTPRVSRSRLVPAPSERRGGPHSRRCTARQVTAVGAVLRARCRLDGVRGGVPSPNDPNSNVPSRPAFPRRRSVCSSDARSVAGAILRGWLSRLVRDAPDPPGGSISARPATAEAAAPAFGGPRTFCPTRVPGSVRPPTAIRGPRRSFAPISRTAAGRTHGPVCRGAAHNPCAGP
jgi:hypothetical protein